MAGHILLAGGAEFGGLMVKPDLRAIELAGGRTAPICIIPTAATPDASHYALGIQGIHWFRSLGAKDITSLPISDRQAADDPDMAEHILQSRLIYLPSGFMGYLSRTLRHSRCWQAILSAYASGSVIAGSGAGAVVLCQHMFEPVTRQIQDGLQLLRNSCVLPHHNMFGIGWVERLSRALPRVVLLGIDERTGLLHVAHDEESQTWEVHGQGNVTFYHEGVPTVYKAGQCMIEKFPQEQM